MKSLKALCIHDLSGIGRCSLTVISPVLSVMGIQCVPLPTAVLSSHLGGFGKVSSCIMTNYCKETLENYSKLNLEFDCVYSGYISTQEQIAIIEKAFEDDKNALKICDPVMGDNGKLYSSVTAQIAKGFVDLCRKSNIITPNTTEAQILLGKNNFKTEFSRQEIKDTVLELEKKYNCSVVITGAKLTDKTVICAGFDAASKEYFETQCRYIPVHFPGTGDLFTAVMAGNVIKGKTLHSGVEKAAEFVTQCVQDTWQEGVDTRFGVNLEKNLKYLIE